MDLTLIGGPTPEALSALLAETAGDYFSAEAGVRLLRGDIVDAGVVVLVVVPVTREIDNMRTGKHEIVHTYGWYIRKFIKDAKAKGAACEIVLSPDPKNTWKDGKVVRADNFKEWAEAAAKEENVAYVDANELIAQEYDAAGQGRVTTTFFPDGETEHTDWAGAILNARCIIAGVGKLNHCGLMNYLRPNASEDPPLPSGSAR